MQQLPDRPAVFVAPRPRRGLPDPPPLPSTQIRLSPAVLQPLFTLKQRDAADRLGISLSSLKTACRRIGIFRWPGSRPPAAAPLDQLQEDHPDPPEQAHTCEGEAGREEAEAEAEAKEKEKATEEEKEEEEERRPKRPGSASSTSSISSASSPFSSSPVSKQDDSEPSLDDPPPPVAPRPMPAT
uniref:RWP-RK domain-containing protein n=1 Tax=Hanusia phi TaxID=3032 RepID=A0A7S0HLH5_9CRYP|mmetsp:Transcript_24032/g.53907  ORF Transcript_24032/g.53907 Transcript_24032/m.53907 type:complete len:184 (+) Transcript_24032:334-885(+)